MQIFQEHVPSPPGRCNIVNKIKYSMDDVALGEMPPEMFTTATEDEHTFKLYPAVSRIFLNGVADDAVHEYEHEI